MSGRDSHIDDTGPDDAGPDDTGPDDTDVAWAFHDGTKYVWAPGRAGDDRILMGTPPALEAAIWEEDPSLEPFPYKVYESLPPIALPADEAGRGVPLSLAALPAIAAAGTPEAAGVAGVEARGDAAATATRRPDRRDLARISRLSNGLLRRRRTTPGGRVLEYRTAGGTGARYHLEQYYVCGDLPDLPAGVYHYSTYDHSLRLLRPGDFRQVLVQVTGSEPAVAAAPVVLVVTSTFWRNAWRYKARAYRHTYWDTGTSLSQALAVAASAGLPTKLVMGFVDEAVNALLDVDGTHEAAIALCAVGRDPSGPSEVRAIPPDMVAMGLPTRQISPGEVDFPLIGRLHRASSLRTPDEVVAWRGAAPRRRTAAPAGRVFPLAHAAGIASSQHVSSDPSSSEPVDDVIMRRRSTRRYDLSAELSFADFSSLLACSSRPLAADCLVPGAPSLHDCYLIVQRVEGLPDGVYVHHRDQSAVELLREGNFGAAACRLAAMQWYAGDAHVNAYYLTDLRAVLSEYGNRGYRLAQLECALYAGRLHLATHALRHGPVVLGAVGSTSFDDEVVDFFAPHAAGKSFMFVTVFGRRRARTGTATGTGTGG
jgi:SagB-type dehydrogenase family enzyme